MINIDKFKEIDLRVAKILSAEQVEGSEKLVKLSLDVGTETRQIIAGIGKKYSPEELIGKEIIIVANLEPRQLMGLESQGMLLAADGGDGPIIIAPLGEVPPGTGIR